MLATQHPADDPALIQGAVRVLPFRGNAGYFFNFHALRRLVARFRPDVLNAHYASGYGLTAALVHYRPTLLSVWGADVFDFPYQSPVKARLLDWNLRRADALASTSEVMARQVRRLVPDCGTHIYLTPFGTDTTLFAPAESSGVRESITIGTVKTLDDKYGIDTLIHGFALLRDEEELRRNGLSRRLRLLLVGDGPRAKELQELAVRLGVADVTVFVGAVAHDSVPGWLNQLDIYVAVSRLDSESFGVAVVEASACGLPVIVSDAGGLPEVVQEGRSGFVIARDRPDIVAERLKRLVLSPTLRKSLGDGGRRLVRERYEWQVCVDQMIQCYESVIAKNRSVTRGSSRRIGVRNKRSRI
jgi:glycosyltransferase involved in cell wall biosynthesis